ncbi:MAG: NUDIX hydrolase [marine benthic group bacterium]|nr:NUDIX hydrolase [Candidatus Benthicola marisminoris]
MSDSGEVLEPGARASRSVYRGKILDVREDTVRFPNGSEGVLEIVRHRGAAAVLPLYRPAECAEGTGPDVILLRQYRYAVGGTLWEAPAGKLDEGEPPDVCAARELEEEAGVSASRLIPLTTLLTTPGFSDERIHLFLAVGLEEGRQALEEHEIIECRRMPLATAVDMVLAGDIVDGKTVCLVMMAAASPGLWDG